MYKCILTVLHKWASGCQTSREEILALAWRGEEKKGKAVIDEILMIGVETGPLLPCKWKEPKIASLRSTHCVLRSQPPGSRIS